MTQSRHHSDESQANTDPLRNHCEILSSTNRLSVAYCSLLLAMSFSLLELESVVYGAEVAALNGSDVDPSIDKFKYTLCFGRDSK